MRCIVGGAAFIAGIVLLTACSTANEAKSYVPEASELCCHGNWKILGSGENTQEGKCAQWAEDDFGNPRACWVRLYYNKQVRQGEPEDLTVHVAVMESKGAAESWLSSYAPTGGWAPSEYGDMTEPVVGYGARAWDYTSEFGWGTEAAFFRENVAVVVWLGEGAAEQRQTLLESVDLAIRDRLVEWG